MREKVFDFDQLEVWRRARSVAVQLYELTATFPKEEKFGLTDQIRRAITSVPANIAEGFSRFHSKDKIKFYHNARGSISETKSHIFLAQDLGYVSLQKASELLKELESIKMLLNALINSVKLHGYK